MENINPITETELNLIINKHIQILKNQESNSNLNFIDVPEPKRIKQRSISTCSESINNANKETNKIVINENKTNKPIE